MLKTLADKLRVQLNDVELCAAHQLLAKSTLLPIIVRLNSYDKNHDLIIEAKKITSCNLGMDGNFPIFLDKHLMKETKDILIVAKKLKTSGSVVAA